MKFIKTKSVVPVIDQIFDSISSKLQTNISVLWLVAGGSAMEIAIKVADKLSGQPNLNLLSISLTDERYGPRGHKDSNWQQLMDNGFKLPGAKLLPVLEGLDFETTAEDYSKMMNNEITAADYSLALAGMGADGHIFGIKPNSPAIGSQKDVIAYIWDDYERLTPTINLIKKLDEVFIYAVGDEKHSQFELLKQNIDPNKQPAQLLKQLQKVTIFNDYQGE